MKFTAMTLALTAIPAILAGQATGSAAGEVQSKVNLPSSYSAESRAKVDAALEAAKSKNLPAQAILDRISEAQAKNANEADVVAAVQQFEARLEASQAALVKGGHDKASAEEISGGAQALEHGVNDAQIEGLAKAAPADRSLAISFTVLNKLIARGDAADKAAAAIQAKLEAKEGDDALTTLADKAPDAKADAKAAPAGAAPAGVTAKPPAGGKPPMDSTASAGAKPPVAPATGPVLPKKPPV